MNTWLATFTLSMLINLISVFHEVMPQTSSLLIKEPTLVAKGALNSKCSEAKVRCAEFC